MYWRDQHRHDDRPQGVENAPAQPERQPEKQQGITKAWRQGKTQAGQYQQPAEERNRARRAEQVRQVSGKDHGGEGAEHRS
ncbi:hypothetical protein D3C84_1073930 [compost metagenome]